MATKNGILLDHYNASSTPDNVGEIKRLMSVD